MSGLRLNNVGQIGIRQKHRGFSLVELLIVIAIISLLAGLLLPVLEDALESARIIACLNNQKQVMLATQQYADDNDGWTYLSSSAGLYGTAIWPPYTIYERLIAGEYLPSSYDGDIRLRWFYFKYEYCPIIHCPSDCYTTKAPIKYAFRGYGDYYTFFRINGPKILSINGSGVNAGAAPATEPLPHSKFVLWTEACAWNAYVPGAYYGSSQLYFNPKTGGCIFHLRHNDGAIGTAAFADGHAGGLRVGDMAEYEINYWLVRLDPP